MEVYEIFKEKERIKEGVGPLFTKEQKESDNYNDDGWELHCEGQYESAISLFKKAIQLNPRHALAMNNLGLSLRRLQQFDDAISWFDRAIKTAPKFVKPYSNKGETLGMIGNRREAKKWFEKALEIEPGYNRAIQGLQKYCEQEYKKADHDLVQFINIIGLIMQTSKDAPNFPNLLEAGIRFACKAQIPIQNDYRKAFFVMGAKLQELGLFKESEKIIRHTYEGCKKLLGPEHPDTLLAKSNLAITLNTVGDLQNAVDIYTELLPILKRVKGRKDSLTLLASANYARCLLSIGDYNGCKEIMKYTHPLMNQSLGSGNFYTIMGASYFAMALLLLGELSEARTLIFESLGPAKRELGEKHPATLTLLHNLSETYRMLGDIVEACRLSEIVYNARREVLGQLHPETLLIQSLTAINLWELGEVKKARNMFSSVLAGFEKVLSFEHPDCLTCAHNYAELLRREGDLDESEELFEKVYNARMQIFGKEHKETITTMSSLSAVKLARKDFATSKSLMEESLKLSTSLFGENHELTAKLRWNFSILLALKGDIKSAFNNIVLALAPMDKSLALRMSNLSSEAAKLTLDIGKTGIDILLTLLFQTSLFRETHFVKQAFSAILRRKGLWAEVERARLSHIRKHKNPHVHSLANKEFDIQRKIAILIDLMTSQTKEIQHSDISYLSEIAKKFNINRQIFASEQLQNQLSSLDLERQVVIAELRALTKDTTFEHTLILPAIDDIIDLYLPEDTVMVDFIYYSKHDFDAGLGYETLGNFYAAFILAKGMEVISINLGAAEDIDNAINDFRRSIAKGQENYFLKAAKNLSNLVLKPIWKHFPDSVEKLILSPDEQLCLIPFECLPIPTKPESFLIEKMSTIYFSTSRDIIASKHFIKTGKPLKALIVAAPDFDSGFDEQVSKKGSKPFKSLPGTKKEGQGVSSRLKKAEYETFLLMGEYASYEEIKNRLLSGVNIFHAATHGVFDNTKAFGTALVLKNPDKYGKRLYTPSPIQGLLHSYLALAGINKIYNKPLEEIMKLSDLGKLTALDILEMDLSYIDMVVLSACQTGHGELVRGEGVFGFRRAFALSGVKYLIMSLWPVDDKETIDLMNFFYSSLLSNENTTPVLALRKAQLEFIKKFRLEGRWPNPFYWAPFICQGSDYSDVKNH